MNLSFLPGDLHLTQNTKGLFIVTMAGREIVSTKSEPYALHKFHSLRIELEHRFPARELTTEDKAELLRNEISDSILRQHRTGEKHSAVRARIATAVLFEVEAALKSYCDTVLSSDLSEHSQADYITGADNFVRWLKGDFDPGSRVAAYRVRKKTDRDVA